MKKQKQHAIPIKALLKEIEDHFKMLDQDLRLGWYTEVGQHYTAAEALIEVLEVYDCGSVGGFSKGQDRERAEGRSGLNYRFKFLADKYSKQKRTNKG